MIREVRPDGAITTVAGDGEPGYSGDGGLATDAALNLGVYGVGDGLAVDAQGDLFIADTFDNAIREVLSDGIITTVAGNGTPGYSGDGGPATDAELNGPDGVAVNEQGDLFIADSNNNVIREVLPDGIITTIAGNGAAGYSGDGGPATAATLNYPSGVAVDSEGDLFVADGGNAAVREVTPDGIINTIVGQSEYDPLYLAVDAQGDLYFTDDALNRLVMQSSDSTVLTAILGMSEAGGVAVTVPVMCSSPTTVSK